MELRGAEFLETVKRRIPDPIKRRIPDSAKQRVRDLVRTLEQHASRAFPEKPPTGSMGHARTVAGRLIVTAESVAGARAAAAGIDPEHRVTAIAVTIKRWRRPYPGWSGRVGAVPFLAAHSVRLPTRRVGRAQVGAKVSEPTPAQHMVDAALAALDHARSLPATLTAAVVVDGPRPPWLHGPAVPIDGRRVSHQDAGRRWASAPPADVRLVDVAAESALVDEPVAVYSRYGLVTAAGPGRVLLDISYDNPIGRRIGGQDSRRGVLTLDVAPGGDVRWQVTVAGNGSELLVAGCAGEPLDAAQRGVLVSLRSLTHDTVPGCAAAPHAAVLARLAATGAPLEATKLGPETRSLLGPELAEIIGDPLPDDTADPLDGEARSVAQRRAAMREHDAGLNATPARSASALPTVTALVATRRPHLVRRAVELLAAQTYPRLDVVVVMHGAELDAAIREELADLPIVVEVVELPADGSLGEALSEATQRARGTLVTKFDDDDQYGPEHIWDLVLARRYSGATVVGKGPEFVYLAGQDLTIRRDWTSETFANVVAGGTIMIARGDLEAVGGWRPVPRSVDRTLLERVIRAGGLVYRAHPFGFVYTRHDEGHTWDPGGAEFFLRASAHQWDGLPSVLLDPRAPPA